MRTGKHVLGSLLVGLVAFSLAQSVALSATLANGPSAPSNQFWWPDRLDLSPLRNNGIESNPLGATFNYANAFNSLDLNALKQDINALLTTKQDWWPSDYGNYGPFFIRMSWHSAGTYRLMDGRGGSDGGQQRFEPLNSWPDNANLDKARRLLWPIKQKYGDKISWSDLIVLTGNVAMENMGFKTIGFAGGRQDEWEADNTYWGPERKWLTDKRREKDGHLQNPLAAIEMGLIYVNPEGPNKKPDPVAAGKDIREAFSRMAMTDEETVALIAGGHAFGKAHGAHAANCDGPEPTGAGIEAQGFGWNNKCGKGNAEDTVTSGLEGAWSATPVAWSHHYLDNLFKHEWVQVKSPAGATVWIPKDGAAANTVPDAHIAGKKHAPMMFTTDLALKFDPGFSPIAKRFQENPKELDLAFAKAWFKLIHRDMGPVSRYLGADVPKEHFLWQDPVPAANYKPIDENDSDALKTKILQSGLTVPELVRVAWASAASFRVTDMRGGANGARIRLLPQKDWKANNPEELSKVLTRLEKIQKDFNKSLKSGKQVSLADTIVLAGSAAIEKAAKEAGYASVNVPFKPGRTDATQEQTDVHAMSYLEPKADGFRNYFASDNEQSPPQMLIERASLLNLTIPEMTVLLGGMRSLNANFDQSKVGILTEHPGRLSNDFFVNLLDISTQWQKAKSNEKLYEGVDRKSGKIRWTASSTDLMFGSHAELRAVAEVYAANNAKEKFLQDFIAAWTKVMTLDRYQNGQKL